jgi:uncharacterized protein (TIRG00374 family)
MAAKKTLSLLLKLAFSLAVLAFIFAKTPLRDIGRSLGGVAWPWLILAFSLFSLGLLISAYRWQILARAQGDEVPLRNLVQSYLVGVFFNNFLPTRFGGDVVRIWDGSKYSKSLLKSSAIVLVERSTGILVLFLFALGASLFRLDMARRAPVIWIALLFGIGGLAAAAFFFLPVCGRWLERIPERKFIGPAKRKVLALRSTILSYKNHPAAFAKAMAWAVLLQVNVLVHYFLIGKALRLSIGLLDYFIFIPLVLLIQILPVSINGLGVRELSYIEIFKFYGIPAGTAVAFSAVEIGLGLIVGLVGGAIYVVRK